MRVMGLAALVLVALVQPSVLAAKSPAFLESELPLTIVMTTPPRILTAPAGDPVKLIGMQAIQVVFSRPVIAMGSDFGSKGPYKPPFTLTKGSGPCPVPGVFRWVSTTIARWDPTNAWPTDLDCTLEWVPSYKAYDDAVLQLNTAARRQFQSDSLGVSISGVSSAKAEELTSGLWYSKWGIGNPDYEVPADGIVTLQFTYPVNLGMLQNAIQVRDISGNPTQIAAVVKPCESQVQTLLPIAVDKSSSALNSNSSCAAVSFKDPLAASTRYQLGLAAGAAYHAQAGKLGADAFVTVSGLRPFTLPLDRFTLPTSADQYITSGPSQRLLDLLLPHGMADETQITALASAITMCYFITPFSGGACTPLPFTLARTSLGSIQLNVTGLGPRSKVRVSVAAKPDIKDGFGQPLMSSNAQFFTREVSGAFAPANVDSSTMSYSYSSALSKPTRYLGPIILEPSATLKSWPYAVFPTRISGATGPGTYTTAAAWVASLDDPVTILRMTSRFEYGFNLATVMGRDPDAQVTRDEAAGGWSRLDLPLPSSPDSNIVLLHTCCEYNTGSPTSGQRQVVIRTSLSALFIKSEANVTVWVTDSAAGAAPVAGATASLYIPGDGSRTFPKLAASCTTGEDGSCTIAVPAAAQGKSLMGWVRKDAQALVVQDVGYVFLSSPPAWQGTLVADRLVVRPGETLHVTGFMQQRAGSAYKVPASAPEVMLEATPSWNVTPGYMRFPGKYNTDGGSTRLEIDVPEDAPMGKYTLNLRVRLQDKSVSPPPRPSPKRVVSGRLLAGGAAAVHSPAAAGDAHAAGEELMVLEHHAPEEDAVAAAVHPHREMHEVAGAAAVHDVPAHEDAMHLPMDMPHAAAGAADVSVSSMDVARSVQGVIMPGFGGTSSSGFSGASTGGVASMPQLDSTWSYVSSMTFTVADPRPPTADLALDLPAYVSPGAPLKFNLTAISYIGAQVKGARVSVTWSVGASSGGLNVTTGAGGRAGGVIPLDKLKGDNATTEGQSVSINVEWVGPTREVIKTSGSVAVASGEWRLELDRTLYTDTPGVPFKLSGRLVSVSSGEDGPLATVTVVLAPAVTDAATGKTDAACSDEVKCGFPTGTGFSCKLALPCTGTYNLTACALTMGAESPICTSQIFGRNATSWADRPWRQHDEPRIIPSKVSYSLGDNAQVYFAAPWPGATGLLLWGNADGTASRVVEAAELALGVLDIPVDAARCRGGCGVMLAISVPRLTGDACATSPVPASKLFDPCAPHTHALTTTLNVVDTALAVEVAVSGLMGTALPMLENADGEMVPYMEPGAIAQIQVSVTDDSDGAPVDGAEVTVYAVDKAMLDVLPYPLPEIERLMRLQLASSFSDYDIEAGRVAPGAVQAVFEALMTRLTINPWLPVDTSCTAEPAAGCVYYGVSAVDMDPYQYASRFSSSISPGGLSLDLCSVNPSAPACRQSYISYTCLPRGYGPGHGPVPASMINPPPAQNGGFALAMMASASAESMPVLAKSSSAASATSTGTDNGGGGSSATSAPKMRTDADFITTPLFTAVKTRADGQGAVTFAAPANLGTFVVRAYAAHAATARYGSFESSLMVRRPLSLTPSLPRFVRVGDTFEAGAIVTAPSTGEDPASASAVQVTISAVVTGGNAANIRMPGFKTKTVDFAPGVEQLEVRFSFAAVALGNATIEITAASDQGDEDALSITLDVTGQQAAVDMATTFALRAASDPATGSSSSNWWKEGLVLPDAVPGSGSINVTAYVGYLSTLQALAARLQQEEEDAMSIASARSLVLALLPAIINYYGEEIPQALLDTADLAFDDLAKRVTHDTYGLLYSDPAVTGWTPTRADLYLNAWAYWLVGEVSSTWVRPPLFGEHPLRAYQGKLEALTTLSETWATALGRQLLQDAYDWRTQYNESFGSLYELAWARAALGPEWAPTRCDPEKGWIVVPDCSPLDLADTLEADLSWARLLDVASRDGDKAMTLETYLVVALTQQAAADGAGGTGEVTVVDAALQLIKGYTRVQGRTAYVAAYDGAQAPAPIAAQVLSLMLQVSRSPDDPLMSQLAAYAATGPQAAPSGPYFSYASYADLGLLARALAMYDADRQSTDPNLTLNVTAHDGAAVLLTAPFSVDDTAPKASSTPWADLPPATRSLNYEVAGTAGEVVITTSLTFVPALVLDYPTYRGMLVEVLMRATDPVTQEATGPGLASLALGTIVTLSVQVMTPDEVGAARLEVRMPAGLEPLDPNLAAGAGTSVTCDLGTLTSKPWRDLWWWWWPECPSQSTSPSMVAFDWVNLRAGAVTVSFKAVAATPGDFSFPPARAYAVQQPELMGLSAAGQIKVCAGTCTGGNVAARQAPAPKGCPKDCSGAGMCNAAKGKCVCNKGFSGADCSIYGNSPAPTPSPGSSGRKNPPPVKKRPPPPAKKTQPPPAKKGQPSPSNSNKTPPTISGNKDGSVNVKNVKP